MKRYSSSSCSLLVSVIVKFGMLPGVTWIFATVWCAYRQTALGVRTENWEVRAVPLPSALVEQLKTLRQRRNGLPSQLGFSQFKGESRQ